MDKIEKNVLERLSVKRRIDSSPLARIITTGYSFRNKKGEVRFLSISYDPTVS